MATMVCTLHHCTALKADGFSREGPVKAIDPSVDLVYRSAFPLVRVDSTLTRG